MNNYKITTITAQLYKLLIYELPNNKNYLFINSREFFEIWKGNDGRTSIWGSSSRSASICVVPRAIFLPREWGTEAYLKQRGWRNINDAHEDYWQHRVVPLDLINLPFLEEHNTRVNVDVTCHRWNIKMACRDGAATILSIISIATNARTCLIFDSSKHAKIYLSIESYIVWSKERQMVQN